MGTFTTSLLGEALRISALIFPNSTVLSEAIELKLLPFIVTALPGDAFSGLIELMVTVPLPPTGLLSHPARLKAVAAVATPAYFRKFRRETFGFVDTSVSLLELYFELDLLMILLLLF
jgi:hypothetical protein